MTQFFGQRAVPGVIALGLRLKRELAIADEASLLSIPGLVLELLAEAMRHSYFPSTTRPPNWLGEVTEYIRANFAEHLTLGGIAHQVGVHPVYLARILRKHQQCTIGEYVRQLRIEFAQKRLANDEASLVEIALAAGFCAQSLFARLSSGRSD